MNEDGKYKELISELFNSIKLLNNCKQVNNFGILDLDVKFFCQNALTNLLQQGEINQPDKEINIFECFKILKALLHIFMTNSD